MEIKNVSVLNWVLRVAVAGEFVGHGSLALQGKQQWVGWIAGVIGGNTALAAQLLFVIGLFDIVVAAIVLLRPVSWVLLWAAFWGFFTALIRPIMGESVLDFVERWTNWGAPLALYLLSKKEKQSISSYYDSI